MSLDFAVLGESGSPEKMVALGVDLHHKLVTAAAGLGLVSFQPFADYYEDAAIAAADLPVFAEQATMLRAQTGSTEMQRFLDQLGDLIAYAVANGKTLHAIAD